MVVQPENKPTQPSPNDVLFVVEGTALCGAYLNELKQSYIIPTLEYFNGGPLDDKDCESASNYVIYGLVVFHASDILPGYLTDAYGPITTPNKLLAALDKIQFAGGYGEAVSHVGEGLATALHCLQDITSFRSPPLETPAKKHIILICNCKPYGLPVTESVGEDNCYRGMTVEQLAAQMPEKAVHLSIMAPRKIPALNSLFDKSGGESSSQKTYAKEPRHLVLLNGFALQERPITPKQVPEVSTVVNLPPPTSTPTSQTQVPTSVNQQLPHQANNPQSQQQNLMSSQQQPPPPQTVAPPPPQVQVQVTPPPTSMQSHAPIMSAAAAPVLPPSSIQQQSSMPMSTGPMSQAQAGSTMSPMMNQPGNNMGTNAHPTQLSQHHQQPTHLQQMGFRNRAPSTQMQNIRQMHMQNQQMNQNQPLNPNLMGPASQAQMNSPAPQQLPPGQQIGNPQQMQSNQPQMNINQQQQHMNQQLSQQLHNQQQISQPMHPHQLPNQQQPGQQMNPQQINQPMHPQQLPNQQQPGQQMNPQQINQHMSGQSQMSTSIPGQRPMPTSQHQQLPPQVSQQQQSPQTNQNISRWPSQNQMPNANPMQKNQQSQMSQGIPLRMPNVNQTQVTTTSQPLLAQSSQQPISSTGIQPSALQQQLQQNQHQLQQQQQPPAGHSPLLAQLQNPPIGSQQVPSQSQTATGSFLPGPPATAGQKERHTIWSGTLEWHEKQKGPSDGQKVTRQVNCQVSANVVNGEPEVKGDGWPQKLIMQLIPKNIVGSLGGSFLVRDVKTVVFLLQNCDALNSLTRVMDSGYAGCVHFTGGGAGIQQASCSIKVLILLYSKDRQTYLGFIPNDQVGFVDRIRKVIQQQKQQQQTTRQGQVFPGVGGMPPTGIVAGQQPGPRMLQGQQPGMVQAQAGMLQGPGSQPGMGQQSRMTQPQQPISQLAQQLGQTPQGTMGQSPVTAQLAQQLGQAQQLQQQLQRQQQQLQNPGMGGNPESQNPAEITQIERERQQNLLAIQQLQQTLQAAQQRELQFQQLQHHPVPGPGGHQQQLPGQGQIQVSQQQQMNQGGPGQQQQQMMQSGPGQQQQQMMQGGPGQQLQQQMIQGGPGQQQPLQQQMIQGGLGQQQQFQQQMMQSVPGQQQLQQQIPRQMMNTTPQTIGQMRLMRASVSQANPGLKHLLQQQPGQQTYRVQMPMQQQQQQQRMTGQMGMPGQMQGPGHMQPNQTQQMGQFEEVGILDLLK